MTNQVLTAIEERRSCKAFRPEQIKPQELDAILKAGTFAATGRNRQSPVMVVLQNPQDVAELSRLNAEILGVETDPFYGAPTVIVVLADTDMFTWVEDGSLVHYKNIIGTPVFTIPQLGYLANYIQNPPGMYLAISAGAILLMMVFIPDLFIKEEEAPNPRRKKQKDKNNSEETE